jgi:hypothetical protein
MTGRSAERSVRQKTGWLAGGPLLRAATTRRTTDTFPFISRAMNVLLFKFLYNIFIRVRIIKEMPGSVASGTSCMFLNFLQLAVMVSFFTRCYVTYTISQSSGASFVQCHKTKNIYRNQIYYTINIYKYNKINT